MDTIAAIATAQGRAGVAIVRVSGENALAIARKMTGRTHFEPNFMHPCTVDCGELKDFGLCVFFHAPRSFTGEDVVEFHCHGGTEIVRGALSRCLELGARLAERGEFTRRAYLNGKLSLSAVEGLGEMIDASSRAQARAGYALYTEALTEEGRRLQAILTNALAGVDADVDYPEEDLETDNREGLLSSLREAEASLTALKGRYKTGKKIREGVNVVLCGRPNAGKSALFNALLGYDRAIVSSAEGTTRDTVEGALEIRGVLFRLTDTAGLREGTDEVEIEGIRRTKQAVKGADVVVYLKEEGDPPLDIPEGTPCIVVGAKSDINKKEGCDVVLSSRTGEGLSRLKELLFERGYGEETDGLFLLEERQFAAVSEAEIALKRAIDAIEERLPAELYAQDLREAWEALGKLTGETATETVIAEIFSKFCVGK